MKQNLAIVTTWFERGAAYVSKQLMSVLGAEYNIYIYARGGEKYAKRDEKWDKAYVWWGKKTCFPIATYIDLKDFENFLKANEIDIVVFNEQLWYESAVFAKQKGLLVGSYVDNYKEDGIELFSVYDFLICNTRRHYGVFKWHPQVFYIPWGTDTELFQPTDYESKDKNRVIFFHSCGMNPDRKGTKFLISATKKLEEKDKLFKVIIHTQVDLERFLSSKDINDLQSLIRRDTVKVINESVGAPGLYHLGDVYVYPTTLEGIGLTIVEAIASGLPTIVPDNPPMNEFVVDGINGKLVKISKLYSRYDGYYWPKCEVDIDDLVEKMLYYIDNAHAFIQIKRQCREYALKHFDWKRNAEKLPLLIKNATTVALNSDIKMKALRYYNRTYPLIYEYKHIYKMFNNLYCRLRGKR